MTKICKTCLQERHETDFYMQKGVYRKECKACCVTRCSAYQKKHKPWRKNPPKYDASYHAEYYAKNREKFREYAKNFKEKNPEYFKQRYRKKLEKPF